MLTNFRRLVAQSELMVTDFNRDAWQFHHLPVRQYGLAHPPFRIQLRVVKKIAEVVEDA